MDKKKIVLYIGIGVLIILLFLLFFSFGNEDFSKKIGFDKIFPRKDIKFPEEGDPDEKGDKENTLSNENLTDENMPFVEFFEYTGQDVAEKIEKFMASMKKANQYYYFYEECDSNKGGPEQVQLNNWAILAYSGLYELTKSQDYKTTLLGNWDFSAADKSSADLYTSFQLYKFYLLTKEYPDLISEKDKEGLFRKINSVGSSIITGYEPGEDYAMIMATVSRASYISSMILDETKSDKSPEIFNNAESLLIKAEEKKENVILKKNDVFLSEGSCWVQLAKLQKYEISKDPNLLKDSSDYFDSLDLDKEFSTPKLIDNSIPMSLLPCAEALIILNEKTGDDDYLDDAREILLSYLKYSWDYKEANLCSGDYGVLSKRITSVNPGRKVFTDNAYFAYLFTRKGINDYVFRWLK